MNHLPDYHHKIKVFLKEIAQMIHKNRTIVISNMIIIKDIMTHKTLKIYNKTTSKSKLLIKMKIKEELINKDIYQYQINKNKNR